MQNKPKNKFIYFVVSIMVAYQAVHVAVAWAGGQL